MLGSTSVTDLMRENEDGVLMAWMLSNITEHVEPELLHTYSKVYKWDVVLLIVRLAVLTAVTLTVPVVLFPVSVWLNHDS